MYIYKLKAVFCLVNCTSSEFVLVHVVTISVSPYPLLLNLLKLCLGEGKNSATLVAANLYNRATQYMIA